MREGSLYSRWHAEASFRQGSPAMLYYHLLTTCSACLEASSDGL